MPMENKGGSVNHANVLILGIIQLAKEEERRPGLGSGLSKATLQDSYLTRVATARLSFIE